MPRSFVAVFLLLLLRASFENALPQGYYRLPSTLLLSALDVEAVVREGYSDVIHDVYNLFDSSLNVVYQEDGVGSPETLRYVFEQVLSSEVPFAVKELIRILSRFIRDSRSRVTLFPSDLSLIRRDGLTESLKRVMSYVNRENPLLTFYAIIDSNSVEESVKNDVITILPYLEKSFEALDAEAVETRMSHEQEEEEEEDYDVDDNSTSSPDADVINTSATDHLVTSPDDILNSTRVLSESLKDSFLVFQKKFFDVLQSIEATGNKIKMTQAPLEVISTQGPDPNDAAVYKQVASNAEMLCNGENSSDLHKMSEDELLQRLNAKSAEYLKDLCATPEPQVSLRNMDEDIEALITRHGFKSSLSHHGKEGIKMDIRNLIMKYIANNSTSPVVSRKHIEEVPEEVKVLPVDLERIKSSDCLQSLIRLFKYFKAHSFDKVLNLQEDQVERIYFMRNMIDMILRKDYVSDETKEDARCVSSFVLSERSVGNEIAPRSSSLESDVSKWPVNTSRMISDGFEDSLARVSEHMHHHYQDLLIASQKTESERRAVFQRVMENILSSESISEELKNDVKIILQYMTTSEELKIESRMLPLNVEKAVDDGLSSSLARVGELCKDHSCAAILEQFKNSARKGEAFLQLLEMIKSFSDTDQDLKRDIDAIIPYVRTTIQDGVS